MCGNILHALWWIFIDDDDGFFLKIFLLDMKVDYLWLTLESLNVYIFLSC